MPSPDDAGVTAREPGTAECGLAHDVLRLGAVAGALLAALQLVLAAAPRPLG
jgi:hypothetical protein